MKLKYQTILLILALIGVNGFSQDFKMAKAFFKKARVEYKNQDYAKAIELIEGAKVHLGRTNPDIMYLEAKIRYKHDLNIRHTKNLIREFVRDADSQDNRMDEMTGMLVDIESSDAYFKNGQIKKTVDYHGKNAIGEYWYEECYEKCKSYRYISFSTPGALKTITYYSNGRKILVEELRYEKVVAQTLYETLSAASDAQNNGRVCKVLGGEDNEPLRVGLGSAMGKSENQDRYLTFFKPKSSGKQLIFYDPLANKKAQFYDEINKALIIYDASEKIEMKLENVEGVTYYQISNTQFPFIDHLPQRMVKSIKVPANSKGRDTYNVYRFDENGRPVTLEFWKKNKLKDTITLKS